MKKIYFLFVILFCTISFAQAQDTITINFRVTFKGAVKKLSTDGIRVAGQFDGGSGGATGTVDGVHDWTPADSKVFTLLTPASDSIYGVTMRILRTPNDTFQYKMLDGKTWGDGTDASQNYTYDERAIPNACGLGSGVGNNNRYISTKGILAKGSITTPAYVFDNCTKVFASGTTELSTAQKLSVYPNPVSDKAVLSFENIGHTVHTLDILNVTGQVVHIYPATVETEISIETARLAKGLYFARLHNTLGESSTVKFIVQ